ncbi:hypothetical protein WJX82_005709 [Trebouxia sp. C0006]
MAARVCCMTSVWEPPHSRDSNIPRLPHMLGRGSFLHGRLPRLRNNRVCETALLQPNTAPNTGRPRHQPVEARVTAAMASC